MSENDGGPAFPVRHERPMPGGGKYNQDIPGMTLRDYFAAAALTGLALDAVTEGPSAALRDAVRDCYELADLMLAQRDQHTDRDERGTD